MEFRDLKDAQVTVLIELNGKIHLVGMDKDKLDAVGMLVKVSTDVVVPTDKTQGQLNKFLGYNK